MSDQPSPVPERAYSLREQRAMTKMEKRRERIARELVLLQEDYEAFFGPLTAREYAAPPTRGVADIPVLPEDKSPPVLIDRTAAVESIAIAGDAVEDAGRTPTLAADETPRTSSTGTGAMPAVSSEADAAFDSVSLRTASVPLPVDDQPTQRIPRWNPAAFSAVSPVNPITLSPPAEPITVAPPSASAVPAAPGTAELAPPIAEPARLEGFFTMAPRSGGPEKRGPVVQRTVISQYDQVPSAAAVPIQRAARPVSAFEPITVERPSEHPPIRRDGPLVQDQPVTEEWTESDRRHKPRVAGVLLSVLLVILLGAGAFFGYEMYQASSKIYPNKIHFAPLPWDESVLVSAGGLHSAEIQVRLENQRDAFLNDTVIDVMIGDASYTITPAQLGLFQDTAGLLEPFNQQILPDALINRTIVRIQFEFDPDRLVKLLWECDTNLLNETARSLHAQLNQQVSPAKLTGFDKVTQEYIVAQGDPMSTLDEQGIAAALLKYVEDQAFGQPLVIPVDYSDPVQDAAALRARVIPLGDQPILFGTLSDDEKANIASASAALDGVAVVPGSPWSLKALLDAMPEDSWKAGESDGAQTWSSAHPGADIVATAVFNAAVKAGLTAQRQNAAIPPDYIGLGMDATLSETADLVLSNPGDQAVILRVTASEEGVSASFAGIASVPGRSCLLEATVLEVLPAPEGTDFERDASIYEGEEIVAHGPLEGQTVQINLAIYQDGVLTETTPLETLTYPAARELVLTGTKER